MRQDLVMTDESGYWISCWLEGKRIMYVKQRALRTLG
jgi:hypothetical protein